MSMRIKTTAGTIAVTLLMALLSIGAQAQASDATDDQLPPVRITSGPVVEHVTDTTATIAWSTNVNAGTTLRYGTDANHLDKNAGMPWGGFTHRVYLRGLHPGTKYYFQGESAKAQGTGTSAQTDVMTFETKPTSDAATQPSNRP